MLSCIPFDPQLGAQSKVVLNTLAVGKRSLQLSFHEADITDYGISEAGFDQTVASAIVSIDFFVLEAPDRSPEQHTAEVTPNSSMPAESLVDVTAVRSGNGVKTLLSRDGGRGVEGVRKGEELTSLAVDASYQQLEEEGVMPLTLKDSSSRRLFFDAIYYSGLWSHGTRDSGYAGGEYRALRDTRRARSAVLDIIASFGASSVVDVPCGEGFFALGLLKSNDDDDDDDGGGATAASSGWARVNAAAATLVSYEGFDVSSRAVQAAKAKFEATSFSSWPHSHNDASPLRGVRASFQELDVLSPGAGEAFQGRDLVVCRLMMIHMSVSDNIKVLEALEAVARPKVIVLTTYLIGGNGEAKNMRNFPLVLGHRIDLLVPPYCLRPPDRLYYEGEGRAYLGLWDLTISPLRDPCIEGDVACEESCLYKGPRSQ